MGIVIKQTKRGDIVIRIPAPILRSATREHPELSCEGRVVVKNTAMLARDVVVELDNDTGDDALTPVQRMLDDAVLAAVEYGSEAVNVVEWED